LIAHLPANCRRYSGRALMQHATTRNYPQKQGRHRLSTVAPAAGITEKRLIGFKLGGTEPLTRRQPFRLHRCADHLRERRSTHGLHPRAGGESCRHVENVNSAKHQDGQSVQSGTSSADGPAKPAIASGLPRPAPIDACAFARAEDCPTLHMSRAWLCPMFCRYDYHGRK
jgi:hypothetical protein